MLLGHLAYKSNNRLSSEFTRSRQRAKVVCKVHCCQPQLEHCYRALLLCHKPYSTPAVNSFLSDWPSQRTMWRHALWRITSKVNRKIFKHTPSSQVFLGKTGLYLHCLIIQPSPFEGACMTCKFKGSTW